MARIIGSHVLPSLHIRHQRTSVKGYLQSRVHRSGPFQSVTNERLDPQIVSWIHPDLLHSTIAAFVTRFQRVIPCDGGRMGKMELKETI